jgi:hypothetical protein
MITFGDAFPLITLLIGGFIGNRLALDRRKRADFNEVANPLFETLEQQRICAESGNFPSSANQTTKETFILVIRKTPKIKRAGLNKAIEAYVTAKRNCGEYHKGHYSFSRPEVLIEAIKNIQLYLPHK